MIWVSFLFVLLGQCTTGSLSEKTEDSVYDFSECTSLGSGNFTGCLPDVIKKYKKNIFIANAVIVIVIGTLTHALNICAVFYALAW